VAETGADAPRLLIVDDDEAIRSQMKWAFSADYALAFAWDAESLLAEVEGFAPEVVTLDLGLPPHPRTADEGLRLLKEVKRVRPAAQVIVITGNPDKENALKAVSLGATDYYSKPVDLDELAVSVRRSVHIHRLETELARARQIPPPALGGLHGRSREMTQVFDLVRRVAPTEEPVLVSGESGTGKELVARAIHQESGRSRGPFVVVNCGGIPETLIEEELFGHEAGAFTDAKKRRIGLIDQASGGTVFLDEVGELPLAMQPKLLRFLQEGTVQRLGGGTEHPVDARVIAASNRDLTAEVGRGALRQDLFYRLRVVEVRVPPLRDRPEDIPLLAAHFLARAEAAAGRGRLDFADGVMPILARYPWPGNVRELENRIRSAAVVAAGTEIDLKDLGLGEGDVRLPTLKEVRDAAERRHVELALALHDGNVSRAAKALGVSRPTLHALLQKHGIERRPEVS
jgi:two-component system NtrC family response regulator